VVGEGDESACPVGAISQDRRAPPWQQEFGADKARFFTAPLPGRDRPLAIPPDRQAPVRSGVDTELVAAWVAWRKPKDALTGERSLPGTQS